MKRIFFFTLLLGAFCQGLTAQVVPAKNPSVNRKNAKMDTEKLNHPIVKLAILALQDADQKTWFSLFTTDAALFDDGHKMDFKPFFEQAFGHERFTSIDKVENKGLDVYGKFHSDKWGNFKTYFKFTLNAAGKINRLDIGQASY